MNTTPQALAHWLNQMFMDRHEKRIMFSGILNGSDPEVIPGLLEKFGGQEAVEIECFGAPISELLKRGYAPGGYSGRCTACTYTHVADKRAITCLTCAVKDYETVPNN